LATEIPVFCTLAEGCDAFSRRFIAGHSRPGSSGIKDLYDPDFPPGVLFVPGPFSFCLTERPDMMPEDHAGPAIDQAVLAHEVSRFLDA
jgi:hypothetical protein